MIRWKITADRIPLLQPLAFLVLTGALLTSAFVTYAFLVPSVALAADPAQQDAKSVQWLDYHKAREQARTESKPLLINFTAKWCKYCKKMKAETYTDPEVIAYLRENYVTALVDTDKEQAIAQEYFVRGLPTIWFLTSEGEKITNLPGFVDAPTFRLILSFIASGAYLETTFSEYMEAEG